MPLDEHLIHRLNRIETLLERIAIALEPTEADTKRAIISEKRRLAGKKRAETSIRTATGSFLPAKVPAKKASKNKPKASTITSKNNEGAGKVVAVYVESFQKRYGRQTRPVIDGRTQGLVKTLLKTLPLERLLLLVQAYLQLEDAWYLTKCHDFPTFYENVTKIGVCLDKGRETSKKTHWDIIDEDKNIDDSGTLRLADS